MRKRSRCVGKGLITGIAAGLAASWTMNQFFIVQSRLRQKFPDDRQQQQQQTQKRDEDNPTVKVAEAVARPILDRGLTNDEKKAGGSVVHYTFGALMGGLYGVMTEVWPASKAGFGSAYATALWAGADEVIVPVLKLSPPPQESPLSQHLSGLGAHIVFGLTTEAVRRALRTAI